MNFAKSIKDFRLDRKKLHPVENIIFISILADDCSFLGQEKTDQKSNEITAIPRTFKNIRFTRCFSKH